MKDGRQLTSHAVLKLEQAVKLDTFGNVNVDFLGYHIRKSCGAMHLELRETSLFGGLFYHKHPAPIGLGEYNYNL